MKKAMKGALMTLACVLLFAGAGWSDVEEFRYFSLDVPDGWTAIEDGASVTVMKDDKTGLLEITADSPEGRTIGELAKFFSGELNGSEPVMDEEGGYSFEFNNGVSQAAIDGDEELYLLIISTGIEQNGAVMAEILGSLEMR